MGVTSPLPPSKGEMQRASIHEQYDIGTGERLGSNIPPAPFKGGDATGKQTRTIRCRDGWDIVQKNFAKKL